MRPSKPTICIDGFSESCWKSLVVKALRVGWPAGLEAAGARLNKSTMKGLLTVGVFEDIFPGADQLAEVMRQVRALEYRELCSWATLHTRGYAEAFAGSEKEGMDASRNRRQEIWAHASANNLWLPPRGLSVYWVWMQLAPTPAGERDLDERPFVGMPKVMADLHTPEGKRLGQGVTLLSGVWAQHGVIGKRVMVEGWGPIRDEMHAEIMELAEPAVPDVQQASLFG